MRRNASTSDRSHDERERRRPAATAATSATRMQRLPCRRRPCGSRQQVATSASQSAGVAIGASSRSARWSLLLLGDRGVDLQAAALEQAVQQALAQRPGLDAPARGAGAQRVSRPRSTVSRRPCSLEAEAVVLQQRQQHRQQRAAAASASTNSATPASGVVGHPAERLLAGVAEQRCARPLEQVRQHALGLTPARRARTRRADHDHAAVGDQPEPQHLAGRQSSAAHRRAAPRASASAAQLRRGAASARSSASASSSLQHAHLRLGFLAAGRFQPHLGHAEQAVQQRLVQRRRCGCARTGSRAGCVRAGRCAPPGCRRRRA